MKQPILCFAILFVLAGCTGRDAANAVPQMPLAPLAGSSDSAPQIVSDGRYPLAALTTINGALYGTTSRGSPYNAGVVFSLTTSGQERFPYRFRGGSDGSQPSAALLNITGTRYGTTAYGGSGPCSDRWYGGGCGTIFSLTKNRVYSQLYAFKGVPDGSRPMADLIDVNGTFYGTTQKGGTSNYGTVFSVSPDGRESTLYSFAGGADGRYPVAGLLNVNGTLYGTTQNGGGVAVSACRNGSGVYDCGIVFSITTSGQERVLYRFQGGSDGAEPEAALINVNGTLYGTTAAGGGSGCGYYIPGCGTVFSITTSGVETVLHSFFFDADVPMAPLLNVNGTLYGTTAGGGGCGDAESGAVFGITTSGQVRILHCFSGPPDGAWPQAGLVKMNGTLYGTTRWGGTGACYQPRQGYSGCGTVFSITTAGQEQVLHSF